MVYIENWLIIMKLLNKVFGVVISIFMSFVDACECTISTDFINRGEVSEGNISINFMDDDRYKVESSCGMGDGSKTFYSTKELSRELNNITSNYFKIDYVNKDSFRNNIFFNGFCKISNNYCKLRLINNMKDNPNIVFHHLEDPAVFDLLECKDINSITFHVARKGTPVIIKSFNNIGYNGIKLGGDAGSIRIDGGRYSFNTYDEFWCIAGRGLNMIKWNTGKKDNSPYYRPCI